uniref:Uncharacterized protein n=1 Tax=Ananas comosus var. bracteatus TaxID=296719 RepID=A0A6V7QMH0_ANACO|nr:unnamed protein product [Ananas comosus var. bracteatus]
MLGGNCCSHPLLLVPGASWKKHLHSLSFRRLLFYLCNPRGQRIAGNPARFSFVAFFSICGNPAPFFVFSPSSPSLQTLDLKELHLWNPLALVRSRLRRRRGHWKSPI